MNQRETLIREYANILDEARTRILGINTIIAGTASLPPWMTAELGYIQLRMLCELVALGCLIAHGDIEATQTKRLQSEYAADSIVRHLERLHSDFYPHPVIATFTESEVHIERIESGFLTKEELLQLYHECGEYLHRGSLSRIYHPTKPKQPPSIDQVFSWGKKFCVLLSQHHVYSLTESEHLLCFISHHQAGGNALVAIAKSPELDQNLRTIRTQ
jgi:hypothetical protein